MRTPGFLRAQFSTKRHVRSGRHVDSPFTWVHRWLVGLLAPALIVGIGFAGVAAPASADDVVAPESSSTSAEPAPSDATESAPTDSLAPEASDPATTDATVESDPTPSATVDSTAPLQQTTQSLTMAPLAVQECKSIGGFEIDGNMTASTCGGQDWATNSLTVGITSQGDTYKTDLSDSTDPSLWQVQGDSPDKGNFERAYSTAYVSGGHYYVFAGWDRTGTAGTGGYVIEIDNAGVNNVNGVPQPDRSQGGTVFFLGTQGSTAPTLEL
jgi:hypothetical protein